MLGKISILEWEWVIGNKKWDEKIQKKPQTETKIVFYQDASFNLTENSLNSSNQEAFKRL